MFSRVSNKFTGLNFSWCIFIETIVLDLIKEEYWIQHNCFNKDDQLWKWIGCLWFQSTEVKRWSMFYMRKSKVGVSLFLSFFMHTDTHWSITAFELYQAEVPCNCVSSYYYFCLHFLHFDISSFLHCLFRIRYLRSPAAAEGRHLMVQSPKEQDFCFLCLSASSFKGSLYGSSSSQHAAPRLKKPWGEITHTHTHRKLKT